MTNGHERTGHRADHQVSLYIPKDDRSQNIIEEIRKLAKEREWSMNHMIMHLLKQALDLRKLAGDQ